MKPFLYCLFFVIAFCGCTSRKEKRILFIGNSYTYRNNMPFLFHQICERKGDNVYVEHITKGKYTFYLQSRRKRLQRALSINNNWDIIILQGSSRDMLKSNKVLQTKTYPAISRLLKRIKINQPKAKVYFYMTWPYKYGYKKMLRANTRSKMRNELITGYTALKKRYKLPIIPIGELWYAVQVKHPDINLYTIDRSHPSLAGSYLTANGIYKVLFNKSVTDLSYHSLLSNFHANRLKKSAEVFLEKPEFRKWYQ